jgi:acetate kinase
MGISIDDEKNINNQTDISAEGSRVRTLVVPTNEELAIAIDTMALVEKLVK